jgi:hypothetical protein
VVARPSVQNFGLFHDDASAERGDMVGLVTLAASCNRSIPERLPYHPVILLAIVD